MVLFLSVSDLYLIWILSVSDLCLIFICFVFFMYKWFFFSSHSFWVVFVSCFFSNENFFKFFKIFFFFWFFGKRPFSVRNRNRAETVPIPTVAKQGLTWLFFSNKIYPQRLKKLKCEKKELHMVWSPNSEIRRHPVATS